MRQQIHHYVQENQGIPCFCVSSWTNLLQVLGSLTSKVAAFLTWDSMMGNTGYVLG